MAMPWWMHTITQRFGQNGEHGVDLGMAPHTPLTALFGGRVISANYGPWGGDLKIAIQGAPGYFEEYLHPDQLLVSAGETVRPGQVIALSGGQNVGGAHPASTRFSSGPHTEFDINQNGHYLNPLALIQGLRNGSYTAPSTQDAIAPSGMLLAAAAAPAVSSGSGSGSGSGSSGGSSGGNPLVGLNWLPFGVGPLLQVDGAALQQAGATNNPILNNPVTAALGTTVQDAGTRIGLVLLALILVLVGLAAFFFAGGGRATTGAVVSGAAGGVGRAIASRGKSGA